MVERMKIYLRDYIFNDINKRFFIGTIVDSHYMDNEGDHGGEHTGNYGSHYMAAEPDSESYSDTGDGHSKNYSAGSEGSYESHSSYSSDSDSGGDYGEHY